MLILLPPSETKRLPPAGDPLDLAILSYPRLSAERRQVLAALMDVSARPNACDTLGVSPRLADAVAANTDLRAAPTAPALEVYTGVLYDALDVASWDATMAARATNIRIFSALFGILTSTDAIPAYRLSGSVNLPGVGPLGAFWRAALTPTLPHDDLIIDARSGTYAAMWRPKGALPVRVFQESGGRRSIVTHMAKHARGLVVRALLSSDEPHSFDDVVNILTAWFAQREVVTATGRIARLSIETTASSIDVVTTLA